MGMKKNVCAVHGPMDENNAYVCRNPNGTTRLRCKECVNSQRVKRYYSEREKAIEKSAEWKRNNRERVRELAAIDRKNNPEKHKKWSEDYYKRNTDWAITRNIACAKKIDINEYQDLFVKQQNKCAICNQEETRLFKGKVMRLCLDHNHKTNAIRELLCHSCNSGIGKFKENIVLLESAIRYLKKHEQLE